MYVYLCMCMRAFMHLIWLYIFFYFTNIWYKIHLYILFKLMYSRHWPWWPWNTSSWWWFAKWRVLLHRSIKQNRRFQVQVELPISHLPIGCRDRKQIIDHHVMPKLMRLRWKSLEETGDPCSAAGVQEEAFEQELTSRLDALNYSGMIWVYLRKKWRPADRDRKQRLTEHALILSCGSFESWTVRRGVDIMRECERVAACFAASGGAVRAASENWCWSDVAWIGEIVSTSLCGLIDGYYLKSPELLVILFTWQEVTDSAESCSVLQELRRP